MKRGLVIIFCTVLIISMSFVSAGFFGDLWDKIIGKDKIELAPGDEEPYCATPLGQSYNQHKINFVGNSISFEKG